MSKDKKAVDSVFASNESFADLYEKSLEEEVKEGDVVRGKVVSVENDMVIIDVGLKSEGKVSIKEFIPLDITSDRIGEPEEVNAGDEVEVYLEKVENSSYELVISVEKARRQEAWKRLEKDYKDGDLMDGVIFGRVKGGFTVDLGGVVAFLPGSQVDIRPVKDIAPLMNVKQPFQILKMDSKQGNIVVSRRAILEEAREGERNEMLSKIKEGVELEGTVKNITDYGAFIDLGSVDGLLHVTDISWSRISHPSEVLTLGQKVQVKVIKFNEDTKRISLGMKQLEGNPWEGIEARFPKNSQCVGHVTNITDYGAFVEIETGIEGLVHVSEISWTKDDAHPSKKLSIGQEVEVMILDIDPDKHRISLGMKQCEDNPWVEFGRKHPAGSIIEGEVKNSVDFGLFVGLDEGFDGLVHISDLSWDDDAEAKLAEYKSGQKIEVKVLAIEPDKERISLGVKQLKEDPRDKALVGIKKGSQVTCVVSEVKDEGVQVTVSDSLSAFIKKSDLARDRIEQRPERFAVGDKVDAKVVSIDKKTKAVTLSIKALEVAEHKKAIEEFGSSDSGASLGDILGAALGSSSKKEPDGKE